MTTNKVPCLCCGYQTLDSRGEYDICPVCFWEDDAFVFFNEIKANNADLTILSETLSFSQLLNIPSGANSGMTLKEARENYRQFSACERSMLPHVRPPKDDEKPAILPIDFFNY